MFEGVKEFLADPLVAPLYLLILLALLNFVLKVFASTKEGWPGQFSWSELPRLLDTLVLRKVVPLVFLGATAYLAPAVQIAGIDFDVKVLLQATYIGGVAIALLSEIATIREAFPGSAPGV